MTNVPFANSEMLAVQIPGSIQHAIDGADHCMPLTHTEEVDAAVAGFIESLNVASGR